MHSIFSDGENWPREIAEKSKKRGLICIGLSDHDAMGGLPEAMEESVASKMGFIPEIEITSVCHGMEIHILGINIDPESPVMRSYSNCMKSKYRLRGREIIRRMEADNWKIDYDALARRPGNIIRIDIAKAVLNWRGSPEEFYGKYLDTGKKYCIEMEKMPTWKAIEMVHKSGGKAVWAHPGFTLRCENGESSALSLAREFVGYGLNGMEVFYRKHTEAETSDAFKTAERLGLLMSAGSDYHWDGQSHPGQYETYGLKFNPKKIIKDFTE